MRTVRYPDYIKQGLVSYLHTYFPKAKWETSTVGHEPHAFTLHASDALQDIAHAYKTAYDSGFSDPLRDNAFALLQAAKAILDWEKALGGWDAPCWQALQDVVDLCEGKGK